MFSLIEGLIYVIVFILKIYLLLLLVVGVLKLAKIKTDNFILKGIEILVNPLSSWAKKVFSKAVITNEEGQTFDFSYFILFIIIGSLIVYLPYLSKFFSSF